MRNLGGVLDTEVARQYGIHMTKRPCRKCNGTGYLPNFAHVNNGICWACGGLGDPTASLPVSPESVERDAALKARAEAARQEREASLAAREAARQLGPEALAAHDAAAREASRARRAARA